MGLTWNVLTAVTARYLLSLVFIEFGRNEVELDVWLRRTDGWCDGKHCFWVSPESVRIIPANPQDPFAPRNGALKLGDFVRADCVAAGDLSPNFWVWRFHDQARILELEWRCPPEKPGEENTRLAAYRLHDRPSG